MLLSHLFPVGDFIRRHEQTPRLGRWSPSSRGAEDPGAGIQEQQKERGLVVEKGDLYQNTWVLFVAQGGECGLNAAAPMQEAPARANIGAGMSSAGVFSSSLQTSHLFCERCGAFGCDSIL